MNLRMNLSTLGTFDNRQDAIQKSIDSYSKILMAEREAIIREQSDRLFAKGYRLEELYVEHRREVPRANWKTNPNEPCIVTFIDDSTITVKVRKPVSEKWLRLRRIYRKVKPYDPLEGLNR